MEVMRKFASVLMVVLILSLSVFNTFVYAEEPEQQETEYTINLIYNNQNIPKESYQTIDNYNAYYNLLSGNLKNDIVFRGYTEDQYNGNQFEGFYNSINYYGNNEYLDFNELTFKAITVDNNVIPFNDCKYFISLEHDTSNLYINLYLLYSPSQTEIYIIGSQICSENIFYVSVHRYYMINNIIDGNYYYSYSELVGGVSTAEHDLYSVASATDGILDIYHYYNFGSIILSSDPIYYEWNGQNDTPNNDLYNNGYTAFYYIFWHLMQGDDTTGFLTDRRIYVGSSPSEGGVIRDEINPEDFNGNLGFKSFYPQSSLNLDKVSGRHLAPFTFIKYQPNNYTRLKAPERVIVKYECQFYCYVKLKNGFFQKWNFYATLDYPLTDAPEELYLNYDIFNQSNPRYQDNYKNDLDINDNQYTNSQDYTYVIDYWWMRQPKFDDDISQVVPEEYKISEMQLYFNTECYLYDSVTGETSKRTTFKLDVLNEKTTFDDGAIDDDDDEYTKFITDHDFDNDDKPVIYVPTVNPVITDDRDISIVVNDNPFPYILVDIPEDQYIDTTPRFGAMMKDIVSAIGEDRNQSIVTLVKHEYDYLPEQATRYITYAVGVICLVGFWKMLRK